MKKTLLFTFLIVSLFCKGQDKEKSIYTAAVSIELIEGTKNSTYSIDLNKRYDNDEEIMFNFKHLIRKFKAYEFDFTYDKSNYTFEVKVLNPRNQKDVDMILFANNYNK